MKQVLFLSSANYYRSRFAAHLFNELARQSGLPWRAISRGLLVGKWGDVSPVSRHAVDGLQSLGIDMNHAQRPAKALEQRDLVKSSLAVAVSEIEHRPLMETQFPEWADLVEYWRVEDVDRTDPQDTLPVLEAEVRDLIARLASQAEFESIGDRELSYA